MLFVLCHIFLICLFITITANTATTIKSKYKIRVAGLSDIKNIRSCNVKAFPELDALTYDNQFYYTQLHYFPKLSLVCELIETGAIVGYVLGSTTDLLEDYDDIIARGLIVSIAVDPIHRGNTLAQKLLHDIHQSYSLYYKNVNSIMLHCRVRFIKY